MVLVFLNVTLKKKGGEMVRRQSLHLFSFFWWRRREGLFYGEIVIRAEDASVFSQVSNKNMHLYWCVIIRWLIKTLYWLGTCLFKSVICRLTVLLWSGSSWQMSPDAGIQTRLLKVTLRWIFKMISEVFQLDKLEFWQYCEMQPKVQNHQSIPWSRIRF